MEDEKPKEEEVVVEEEKVQPAEEDVNAKLEEAQTQLQETKEKLEQFEKKDINFKNLKTQTEEEKQKHQDEKKTLEERIVSLEEDKSSSQQAMTEDWKNTAVQSFVGGDEEKTKAIQAEYDILNMPTSSREEINARVIKAVKLAGYDVAGDITSIPISTSREPERKEKSFHETDKGQAMAKSFAPELFKKEDKQ